MLPRRLAVEVVHGTLRFRERVNEHRIADTRLSHYFLPGGKVNREASRVILPGVMKEPRAAAARSSCSKIAYGASEIVHSLWY